MFIELQIQAEGRDARLVRRADEGLLIGRSAECNVEIADPAAAPHQARLVWNSGPDATLEPLGPVAPLEAIGGLRVDGHAVSGPVAVHEGQKIIVGPVALVWRWLPRDDWPTTPGGEPGPGGAQAVAATQAEAVKEGRYKVGAQVGRGGMGKVLEAQDTPLRRSVAMKVLLALHDPDARERFIREARITGKLEHPSIVPVHELNTDEHGGMFYTMKLVKGATLSAVLKRLAAGEPEALQRFGLPALLTIFQKVCDAVAFAHGQTRPIIHRDLKPDNIMIGDYGEVLVMDWGLAREVRSEDETVGRQKSAESGEADADTHDGFMTQHGQVMGTPGYMAPEQARGEVASLDERTDIYALGAILHALLTLHPPRKLTTAEAIDLEDRRQNGEDLAPGFLQKIAPLLSDPPRQHKFPLVPKVRLWERDQRGEALLQGWGRGKNAWPTPPPPPQWNCARKGAFPKPHFGNEEANLRPCKGRDAT